MPSTEDICYAAGILDGEGCISIDLMSPCASRKYYYNTARVIVINVNLPLLEWLQCTFGGKITTRTKVEGRKTCYRWQIFGDELNAFVKLIIPYLRVKKEQARLVLDFKSSMGKTGRAVSEEVRNYRLNLYEQCRKLNQTGDH